MKTIEIPIQVPNGFKIDSLDKEKSLITCSEIPKSINERIKTLQDAIDELGELDEEVIELRKLENSEITSHVLYHQQAVVIAKALQDGWVADYSNSNQTKYTAYYKISSSGGFVCDGYVNWNTRASVGSRLCFPTSELAKYFGTQFIEIHRKYL
ncbi:hypothetical protein AS589_09265 [Empedobacter brevis]|uniref:hypothetical protein n=1 Tax=Empedobacter brevis TaxID=247 RepID=UPI00131FE79C|nr:hypothetical protein [Empedobacter brevis]QHC84944.1 hypothetical protein AS589_09265 [Empedobacter brevis]